MLFVFQKCYCVCVGVGCYVMRAFAVFMANYVYLAVEAVGRQM